MLQLRVIPDTCEGSTIATSVNSVSLARRRRETSLVPALVRPYHNNKGHCKETNQEISEDCLSIVYFTFFRHSFPITTVLNIFHIQLFSALSTLRTKACKPGNSVQFKRFRTFSSRSLDSCLARFRNVIT